MVSCLCSDEEIKQSSPEVVEVPPPLLRWWRCLHHPLGGGPNKNLEGGILPGSKYPCDLKVKVVFFVKRCKLCVVSSILVPLKGNGKRNSFKVSISPLLVINILSFDVAFCVLQHLMFLMAIGDDEKCLAGCRVTNSSSIRVLFYSTNCLGALEC